MKPAPSETAELLHRLREQLILAQVRLMELEDQRDDLTPQVATLEDQLTAAQRLADRTIEENAHLRRVQEANQAELQHQRHLQHVTHEAWTESRARLAETETALAEHRRRVDELTAQCDHLQAALTASEAQARQLDAALTVTRQTGADQTARITQLDAERRALHASRSWRWTAWLRALERRLGGRGPS